MSQNDPVNVEQGQGGDSQALVCRRARVQRAQLYVKSRERGFWRSCKDLEQCP